MHPLLIAAYVNSVSDDRAAAARARTARRIAKDAARAAKS
jgi:hypothetical protein